jgi:hypothetical protein
LEIGFFPGLGLLALAGVAALLGLTGQVRYSGRMSCMIVVLIIAGLSAVVSSVWSFLFP